MGSYPPCLLLPAQPHVVRHIHCWVPGGAHPGAQWGSSDAGAATLLLPVPFPHCPPHPPPPRTPPCRPQELLGHGLAVYHSNSQLIQVLQEHLSLYGYVPVQGPPTDPLAGAPAEAAVCQAAGLHGIGGAEQGPWLRGMQHLVPSNRPPEPHVSAVPGQAPRLLFSSRGNSLSCVCH